MKFPWHKYIEIPLERRNTLQIFITNRCNLSCKGCFARNITGSKDKDISPEEYERAVDYFVSKGGKQVNLLGGEPFLHPHLHRLLCINAYYGVKSTIYTNGYHFDKIDDYLKRDFESKVKLRVSIYSEKEKVKSYLNISENSPCFDANFMVSSNTTVEELILAANRCENIYKCKVFFISSLRELDNPRREFFDDTDLTMPVIRYKELVHTFLSEYEGNMDIHVSKRGVFESTTTLPDTKCRFANYFIGGKIIQCPYDIVNEKYQNDYDFNCRNCQHSNSCLMSKVVYRKK